MGSGLKSTPISKTGRSSGLNGTPRTTLFNKESAENTDPNVIDSNEQATVAVNAKQNGSLPRQDSLNDVDDDDDEENPFFDFHNESKDAEEIYSEALLDELKQLQVALIIPNLHVVLSLE